MNDADRKEIQQFIITELEKREGQYIADFFANASEAEKEQIAQDLALFMAQNARGYVKRDTAQPTRYLIDGADINTTVYGSTTVANQAGHAGPTLPNIINLASGFQAKLNARSEANQLDIKVQAGSGADCAFDHLISTCWATEVSAGRGTEGQTFTSLTGCTFRVWSNITQTMIDATVAEDNIAICRGVYSVAVNIDKELHFWGIAPITPWNPVVESSPGYATLQAADGADHILDFQTGSTESTVRSLYFESGGTGAVAGINVATTVQMAVVDNCQFQVGSSSGYGIRIDSIDWRVSNCFFSGSGTGLSVPTGTEGGIVSGCRFESTVGISCGEDILITGNHFNCTTGISLVNLANDIAIVGNYFLSCTTAIATAGAQASDVLISNNKTNVVTTFINVSTLTAAATSSHDNWVIAGNMGHIADTGVVLAFPVGTLEAAWIVEHNVFFEAGTGTISLTSGGGGYPGIKYRSNYIDASATGSNTRQLEPRDGGLTQNFTGDIYWIEDDLPLNIGVSACTIRFGDTLVQVSRQTTGALTASATNYIEIDSAGTLSFNTSGFTAGSFPVLQVVCGSNGGNATYSSHVNVGGVLYVQRASGGGVPAPSPHPFVGVDHSGDDDYTLTPNVDGIGVGGGDIDVYSDNGVTQTGEWDSTTGHIGIGGVISTSQALLISKTIASGNARGVSVTLTGSTASPTGTIQGLFFQVTGPATGNQNILQGASGTATHQSTGTLVTLRGIQAGIASSASSGAITNGIAIAAIAAAWTGDVPATTYGLQINNQGGTGAVAYGIYVVAQTGSEARSWIADPLVLGATDAQPASGVLLDLQGALNLLGVTAPGTPAADNAVAYLETGTDAFKVKDDNAVVRRLNHDHTVVALIDGATASTTVPFVLVGPMPHAGSVAAVYAKTNENVTIGATDWIGDIHKILVADLATDGQGTTIYTTQANRPTIATMYTAATAPDVTTFAAGDWFAFYTDQAGSGATYITVSMLVRYT